MNSDTGVQKEFPTVHCVFVEYMRVYPYLNEASVVWSSIAFAGERQPPLRSNRLPALNQSDWRAILTVQSDSASVA